MLDRLRRQAPDIVPALLLLTRAGVAGARDPISTLRETDADGDDVSPEVRRDSMTKRVRRVAGRSSNRLTQGPPDADAKGGQKPWWHRILLWPVWSLWNLVGTVAVAVIVAYVVNQQGLLVDTVERGVFDSSPLDYYQYSEPSDSIEGYAWVSNHILAIQEARSSGHEAIRKLVHANEAFPRDRATVGFILRGTRAEPITITQMTAKVVGRRPAPSAMLVDVPPHGGPRAVMRVGFDLDSPAKVARKVEPDGTLVDPLMQSQHFVLAKDEELSFSFEAVTTGSEVLHWEIEMHVKDHDHEQIVVLGGPDFVVSGATAKYTKTYNQYIQQYSRGWYLDD